MYSYSLLLAVSLWAMPALLTAQKTIPLYPHEPVPNSTSYAARYDTFLVKSAAAGKDSLLIARHEPLPTLTLFSPVAGKATHTAVVVCSGGSYGRVANMEEGFPAARKLAEQGITAFVLNYRVPNAQTMENKTVGPIQDAQRALLYVRAHAREYGIDTHKVGIMGFSAGGHLVSTVATHFDSAYTNNPKGGNLRPDFVILVYPVISFADSLTHLRSRNNLIGPDMTPEKIQYYSNELQVTPRTPPVFIVHAMDDGVVKVANSLLFTAALQQQQVPVQLFLYNKGGHGFGVNNKQYQQQWIDPCIQWILQH